MNLVCIIGLIYQLLKLSIHYHLLKIKNAFMDFEIRDFIRVERLTENKQYVIHNYKIEYSVPTTETYIYTNSIPM